MTLLRSALATGSVPIAYPAYAGVVVAQYADILLSAAPVVGDVLEIGALPDDCKLVGLTVSFDQLDSGAGIACEVGLLDGDFGDGDNSRDIATSLKTAVTLGQTGGAEAVVNDAVVSLGKSGAVRGIGVKVTSIATGFQPGAIRLIAQYASI